MRNMFSGNTQKEIPHSLQECYQTDAVTRNLWVWCERIETWGRRLCILLAIIGVISIISTGIIAAEYSLVETDPLFVLVAEEIFAWALYCFLEYCAYHVLALLIASLATIVQSTKIRKL